MTASSTALALPGQPHIAYQGSELMVEGVRLSDLARTHGTPLFVYSKAAMLSALAAYQRGFAGRKATIHYAMKANSSLAILQLFAQAGCGFDIVSGGELQRALAAAQAVDQQDYHALAALFADDGELVRRSTIVSREDVAVWREDVLAKAQALAAHTVHGWVAGLQGGAPELPEAADT